MDQNRAPIYEALEQFRKNKVVPFDVPGHKRGRGNPEMVQLLGKQCVELDVNSMKPLDNLCHPISVIKEAEELAAEAFGASHAYLMVGGTTSAVQSMVLTACKKGEKIILPRNVHRSVIIALVVNGATTCWCWWTKPTEPIFTSGKICPLRQWRRERTWHPSACTSREAA